MKKTYSCEVAWSFNGIVILQIYHDYFKYKLYIYTEVEYKLDIYTNSILS